MIFSLVQFHGENHILRHNFLFYADARKKRKGMPIYQDLSVNFNIIFSISLTCGVKYRAAILKAIYIKITDTQGA